jgi:hypothetical protein
MNLISLVIGRNSFTEKKNHKKAKKLLEIKN